MRTTMLSMLVAALALAISVTTATANRLSLSSTQFRMLHGEATEAPPLTVLCAATFEGSFHSSTITKVRGALIGQITRAQLREATCKGGSGTILRETLPWHITYDSFTGILPNITTIHVNVIGMSIRWFIELFGECLIRTTAERPAKGIFNRESGGKLTSYRWDETALISGTGICSEGETHLIGANEPTVLGSTTAITLTLI